MENYTCKFCMHLSIQKVRIMDHNQTSKGPPKRGGNPHSHGQRGKELAMLVTITVLFTWQKKEQELPESP